MLTGLVAVVLALSFAVSVDIQAASAFSAPGGPLVPPPVYYGGPNPSIPGPSPTNPSTGQPVNIATGDYYFSATDLSVTTYGPALDFTRTYDSDSAQAEAALETPTPGPLGYGWTENWASSLEFNVPSANDVTVVAPDGAQTVFVAPSGGSCTFPDIGPGTAGTYCALAEVSSSLTHNSATSTYALLVHPSTTWSFNSSGRLTAVTDPNGAADTVSYDSPSPGSGDCPSSAASCETVTAASGRTLTIAWSAANDGGLVTSVTDTMGRTWTYGYDANTNLTSVTDPLGRVTSYTYDTTDTDASLRHDMLTVTKPNGQPGGPDAGQETTNLYDSSGRVVTPTDATGRKTHLDYSEMNPSTGTGTVDVTDSNGSEDSYTFTGNMLTSKTLGVGGPDPVTTQYAFNSSTLLTDQITVGSNVTSMSYDSAANVLSQTDPLGNTATYSYNSFDEQTCAASPGASSPCSALSPPPAIAAGTTTITPPSSVPPPYVTYSEYDTDGNLLWTTTGVYAPGSQTASYARTTYDLYAGESVTLDGTTDSCDATPPSSELPCATIDADGNVTQLGYDSHGDLTSSSTSNDSPGTSSAGTIGTFAGGLMGSVPGTEIAQSPEAVATASVGGTTYAYVTDAVNNVIRRIDLSTDQEQVLAGNYAWGHVQGIGGLATRAELCGPAGGAADGSGDLVIADSCANMVDYVPASSGTYFGQAMTVGDIYTIAGNGTAGYSGDGGAATSAELAGPSGVAIGPSGGVAIADTSNNVIRFVPATSGTYFGRSMTGGDIYTLAGDGTAGYSGDSSAATSAELSGPQSLAFDASGDLAIADTGNSAIRFVPNASGTHFGRSTTAGDIYTLAGNGTAGYSGDGSAATGAELSWPYSVAFDASGDLAIADTHNNVVRFVPVSSGSYYGRAMTADDIYTVAGDGTYGDSGDGGAATSAELGDPVGIAVDAAGDLVIAANWVADVRVVAASTGNLAGQSVTANDIYLIAGDGTYRYSGNGGPASQAELSKVQQVRVDSAGDVVIADSGNNVVRFVPASTGTYFGQAMTAGDIYAIAGDGTAGYSGDGASATSAELDNPNGAEIGPTGNLAIADSGNNVVRFVPASTGTYFGRSMTGDDIYTVAGTGTAGYSGDGASATSAELNGPTSVAIDASGGIVIADANNNVIRYLANTSGTYFGRSMTAGDIYTVAGTGTAGYSGNGASATSAKLADPLGMALDGAGDVVIADSNNSAVRFLPVTSGTYYGQAMTADDIYTIAGDGTAGWSGDGAAATSAELSWSVNDVTVDPAGDLYITDSGNDVIRFVPVTSGSYFRQAMTSDDIYTVAGAGWIANNFSGDGGAATSATFDWPASAAPDPTGGVYIADYYNNRVRHVVGANVLVSSGLTLSSVTPTISTSAGGAMDAVPATAVAQEPDNVATATVGGTTYAYVTDWANNVIRRINLSTDQEQVVAGNYAWGSLGVGGPATSAELESPCDARADSSGDLAIADTSANLVDYVPASSGTYFGQVMTAGDIYTVAGNGTAGYSGDGGAATSAEIDGLCGVAIGPSGGIAIADSNNNVARFVPATSGTYFGRSMTAGDIYTVAGNGTAGYSGDGSTATSAELSWPTTVALDASGDLAIADYNNNVIRFVPNASGIYFGRSMTAGDIYTVAGNGTGGYSGDGSAATSAELSWPGAVAFDASGDLAIADSGNNVIRFVPVSSGSYYGRAMTADDIYTVAGDGTAGSSGNGSAATSAEIDNPSGIAIDSAGDLVIASWNDDAIRVVPASTGTLAGQSVTADDIYLIAGDGSATYSGNGSPASQAELAVPQQVRVDSAGDVVITDAGNDAIRVVPASTGTYFGQAMTAGDIYTIAGNGTGGHSGDGGPATSAELDNPNGAEIGPTGNLAIADSGNNVVRFVPASTGTYFGRSMTGDDIYTVAGTGTAGYSGDGASATSAELNGPTSVAIDASGGIVIADANNNVIRYVPNTSGTYFGRSMTAGDIYTVAGTGTAGYSGNGASATGAELSYPQTVALDGAGDVAIADSNNSAVRFLPVTSGTYYGQAMTADDIYTIAGDGTAGWSGDGAAATSAELSYWVSDATVDGVGDLYITDSGNDVIRFVPVTSGSYYGQAMTADHIYTVAGIGWSGDNFSGDGGDPTTATLNWPVSAAPDPAGGFYIADYCNNRVRHVTVSFSTTTYTYDADGELLTTVLPDGNQSGANAANYTTTNTYDADGEVTSTTLGAAGSTVVPRTTTYRYDSDGNLTSVEDARGYTTTNTYDADNQKVLVTDPDGNETLTCYDGDGNVAETVPPVGVAESSLTPASCAVSNLFPSGYESGGVEYAPVLLAPDATAYTYDANGNETAMTTPAPAGQSGDETTLYTYDADGNLQETIAPPPSNASGAPNDDTYDTYNADDELASETTGYGTTAASTTSYCYDPNGDTTAVVASDGNAAGIATCETSYPWVVSSASWPTQAAYQTTYGYDSVGELAWTTLPATSAAPNGITTSYTYDPQGNKLTSTDALGVVTSYTYTPTNLVSSINYSGTSSHPVTYSYDANGNRTAMTDASGSSSYSYDPFGELISAENGAGQTVAYSYNDDGEVTGITYPLPASTIWATTDTVGYGYDHADELTSVTDFNDNTISISNTADGLPYSETLGTSGDSIATTYDATDSPSAIDLKSGSTTLLGFSYSDAPSGAILTETDTPSSSQAPADYGYDAAGRVTSMTPGSGSTLSYGFDASGNLTTLPTGASGTYDDAGELTSSVLSGTTTGYTYNADGEQLSATQGLSTIDSGTWNGAGELTSYSDPTADMTSATYDGNGLRASETSVPSGGSQVTQDFVWNTTSSVPSLLMDSTNAYIFAGSGTPLEQVSLATGTVDYLVADSLASVRGVVASSGSLAASSDYDAWGNPETTGGLSSLTPFGFAGAYTDVSGMIYLIGRYYDPATGQFLSVDPMVEQTLLAYEYATDNPVSRTDPNGMVTNPGSGGGISTQQATKALLAATHVICTIRAGGCYRVWNNTGRLVPSALIVSFGSIAGTGMIEAGSFGMGWAWEAFAAGDAGLATTGLAVVSGGLIVIGLVVIGGSFWLAKHYL